MNRIEIIATFTSIDKMLKKKNYDDIQEIVDEVLFESRSNDNPKKKLKKSETSEIKVERD